MGLLAARLQAADNGEELAVCCARAALSRIGTILACGDRAMPWLGKAGGYCDAAIAAGSRAGIAELATSSCSRVTMAVAPTARAAS